MTDLKWSRIKSGVYLGTSEGTGKKYSIVRTKVISSTESVWSMFEGPKPLGERSTLQDCQRDIADWDTEPE